MPTYGQNKVRTMARSVLPSDRRKGARFDLAVIKRRNRRQIRQTLGSFSRHSYIDSDPVDLFEDLEADTNFYPDGDIHYAVYERRNGDKTAPLERWAEARAKKFDDPIDAYMWFKQIFSDNLVGRHALSHVRDVEGVQRPGDDLSWRYRLRQYRAQEDHLADDILELINNGGHGYLNRLLKENHNKYRKHFSFVDGKYQYVDCDHKVPLLMDSKGIDDFITAIRGRGNRYHEEWERALMFALNHYKD